jgi:hypothetical protein
MAANLFHRVMVRCSIFRPGVARLSYFLFELRSNSIARVGRFCRAGTDGARASIIHFCLVFDGIARAQIEDGAAGNLRCLGEGVFASVIGCNETETQLEIVYLACGDTSWLRGLLTDISAMLIAIAVKQSQA